MRDQITHLAFFDGIARLAVADPAQFERYRDGLGDRQEYIDSVSEHGAGKTGHEILDWWTQELGGLLNAALDSDPNLRVPWFDSTMSLASKLTARLMETWAHGQDVVDALDLERRATSRLKHVARIGVLSFASSFTVHGVDIPESLVRVSLAAPDGQETWEWGNAAFANSVVGAAEDFCLVVTQRRHVLDTSLKVTGETANAWMKLAQAFAGPPGYGREHGQFPSARG